MSELYINGIDKIDILCSGSLQINKLVDRQDSCSLSLFSTVGGYLPLAGYDLQVRFDGGFQFGGIIKTIEIERLDRTDDTNTEIKLNISCDGYRAIPYRRTVLGIFEPPTYSTASDVINAFMPTLAEEGIGTGNIETGAAIELYSVSAKTIGAILDDMATLSGYQWYISDDKELYFVDEQFVLNDPRHIDSTDPTFSDFNVIGFTEDLTEYANKVWVRGGLMDDGYMLVSVAEDTVEIAARAALEGTSGVYSFFIDDSNVVDSAIGLDMAQKEVIKRSRVPKQIVFETYTEFVVSSILQVKLPGYGIAALTKFFVEAISISETDNYIKYTITATYRNQDNFSTKKTPGATEFFNAMLSGDKSNGIQPAVINVASETFMSHIRNTSALNLSNVESTVLTQDIVIPREMKITINVSVEILNATAASNITLKTYVNGVVLPFQPTYYCKDTELYTLTYNDVETHIAAGTITVTTKAIMDANTATVAIGQAVQTVQMFAYSFPTLSNCTTISTLGVSLTEIDLDWVSPTSIYFSKNWLYRHTSSLVGKDRDWCIANATALYNGTLLHYDDSGLTTGVTYYYKIFSEYMVDGDVYYSTGLTVSGTPSSLDNPTSFAGTTIDIVEIDFTWVNPTATDFSKVELYRHTSSLAALDRAACEAAATLIYFDTGTSFDDIGLVPSTTYYYKIFGDYINGGNHYYSSGVALTKITDTVANPTSFAGTVISDVQINFTWTNITESHFSKVELYRHTSDLTALDRAACNAVATRVYFDNGTSYNDTGLTGSTTYYYKIFTDSLDGANHYYSSGVATSKTTDVPAGPSNLYVYGGSTSVRLSDCDGYAPNTWTNKADIPSPARDQLAASTINSKGYIYAGNTGGSAYLRDCDEYTPNTWVSKTDMPLPIRYGLTASTIGTKGYVYNGRNSAGTVLRDCEEYNPDTWTSKTDTPSPTRFLGAASTIGTKGYIYCGIEGSGFSDISDCDEYSPDTWASKTNAPSPTRNNLAASTLNLKGYILGGYGTAYLADCDEYSPDTWTNKTDIVSPARYVSSASSVGTYLYICGGYVNTVGYLNDCDRYSVDTWTSMSNMPTPARSTLAQSSI